MSLLTNIYLKNNLEQVVVNLPQNETESTLNVSGLCSNMSKTLTIGATNFLLSTKVVSIAAKNFGLCLGNFISPATRSLIGKWVSPIARMNNQISKIFGNNLAGTTAGPAVLEELEFRFILQDLLLKRLPGTIIQQIFPNSEGWTDSTIAKVSRVVLTALIFAICHSDILDCSTGGGLAQLSGGLLYSAIYEFQEASLIQTINLHVVHNLISNIIPRLI